MQERWWIVIMVWIEQWWLWYEEDEDYDERFVLIDVGVWIEGDSFCLCCVCVLSCERGRVFFV